MSTKSVRWGSEQAAPQFLRDFLGYRQDEARRIEVLLNDLKMSMSKCLRSRFGEERAERECEFYVIFCILRRFVPLINE